MSFVLAFREIVVKQTYKNLAKIISDISNEYVLPVGKITNVVTDGGSAFCKAFRVYAAPNEPMPLNENVIDIEEDEEECELSAEMPFMQDMGEYYESNVIDFAGVESVESFLDINEDHDEILLEDEYMNDAISNEEAEEAIILPPQRRCVSHLLNLISDDFEKELTGSAKTMLVQSISKLRSLWVLVGRSSLARKICIEVTGYALKTPCITRWNSKFDAVNQISKLKVKINPLILQLKAQLSTGRNLTTISTNEWIVIEEYIKIAQPIACALDKLQGEVNGSQGYIVPTLLAMKHYIATHNCRQITQEFKRVMLKVVDARFM